MYERLMVAFNGSAPSRRALEEAIGLASRHKAELYTITIVEGLPNYVIAEGYAPIDPSIVAEMATETEREHVALIDEAKRLASDAGVQIHAEIVTGNVVESIVQAVRDHGCDLLIIGLGRHPGLISSLVSHTGYDVTERAPCSVLGVR